MDLGKWYFRRGRIDRTTYWLHYFLPIAVIGLVADIVVLVVAGPHVYSATGTGTVAAPSPAAIYLPGVLFLLFACPSISSQVTRLHDRGHSAWWLFWALVPFAGGIVLLVQMCLPGDPGPNRYGPPPAPRNPVPEPPYPATYR